MVTCPKCKKQVSESATICPHCECDIEKINNDLKMEKKRAATEKIEKARLAAEKEKKQKNLPIDLFVPNVERQLLFRTKFVLSVGSRLMIRAKDCGWSFGMM